MSALLNDITFERLRADFPALQGKNRGNPLIYLDSASSAQKPQSVINAMSHFYLHDYANIHRGVYELSERATHYYENAREKVKNFIHAKKASEIVFVRGTTEGINLVAQSFGRSNWKAGDEVILSEMEHHANIVPWYLLKTQMGIELKIIPIDDEGKLNIEAYRSLFSSKTKLVAISHVSNALGNINPIKEITEIAHQQQVPVLVDGAQAVPHMPVNVADLDCDFYVFSAHKLYGPTGVGVLYVKQHLLDSMPPYQGGGDMIEKVSFEKIQFAKAPHRFEAGTPAIAEVIGLAAAIDYLQNIGMQPIFDHEQQLLSYAQSKLNMISNLQIIGCDPKVGVISFVMEGIHAHDIASVLDSNGVAVRAGHHCAMPLMTRLQLAATARVSFGMYNHFQDVDVLIESIELTKRLFG